jgi:ParB-like chromosome segregation protein Spo0J
MTERVALSDLKPAPWNPRLIKDARFENLCKSIAADPTFLEQRPILALADGTIYAGNMRYRAVSHLGWADVPAVLADIPEQLARERALRDNAQWGEWQDDELAEMLYGLQQAGSALDLLGFEDDEITRLLNSVSGTDDGEPDLTPGPDGYKEQYGVIVICADEAEQEQVYGALKAQDYTCRVVTT